MSNKIKPSEEQLEYATILQKVGLGGLGILIVSFIVYVFEVLPTTIPINEIPRLWGLRVDEFIEKTGMPTGWHWVPLLHNGDMVSFLGIVILAAASLICFLAILPTFIKKKDTPFVVNVAIQIIILLLAASGIISGGD